VQNTTSESVKRQPEAAHRHLAKRSAIADLGPRALETTAGLTGVDRFFQAFSRWSSSNWPKNIEAQIEGPRRPAAP